jgi:hypothetical protein
MSVKAREFGATAARQANEAAPVIGEKMKSLASAIRENRNIFLPAHAAETPRTSAGTRTESQGSR